MCWIGDLRSSPWLWEDRFVVGGESMNFLIDAIVTNISGLGVMVVLVVMLMLLLGKLDFTIVSVTVVTNLWWWTS